MPPHDPILPADCTLSYIPPPASVTGATEELDALRSQLPCWTVAGGSRVAPATVPAVGDAAREEVAPKPSAAGYTLERMIGRGGMGEVWEARQEALHRTIAVKRVRQDRLDCAPAEASALTREFVREAIVTAHLQHPNIVPVHDLGTEPGGGLLLAMKRIDGEPWNRVLTADFDTMREDEFLHKHLPILVQMAQAVAFAHSRGVVHRDLKPSQVIVGAFGEVVLADWGLAVCVGEEAKQHGLFDPRMNLPSVETASNPSGTPALMAPEQTASDAIEIGPWTDIYLLGGTLYFLLTGTYPHESPSGHQSMLLAQKGEVQPPAERAPERAVPAELAALAMAALRPRPRERISSAEQFIAGIRDYLTGANRRRESERIVEEVQSVESTWRSPRYAEIEDSLSKVDEALRLWQGNGAATSLRSRLLQRYARAALASGDLTLARAQAERVEDQGERTELLRAVAEGERDAARQRTTRRIALGAVAALVLVVLVGGTVFIRIVQRERAEALQQREAAETRVAASQQLVNTMLGAVSETLDRSKEHDQKIALAMTDAVWNFVEKLDVSTDRPPVKVAHADFLTGLAKNFRTLGRVDRAEPLAVQSAELRRANAPNDTLALTYALHEVAAAASDRGDSKKAFPLFEEILAKRRETLGATHPDTLRAAYNLAVSMQKQELWDESIILGTEYAEAAERIQPPPYNELAMLHMVTGASMANSGRPEEALPSLQRCLELLDEAPAPDVRLVINAVSNISAILNALKRYDEAIAHMRVAVDRYLKLFGPAHPSAIGARHTLGAMLANNRQYDEALKVLRANIATIERDAPELRRELVAGLLAVVDVLALTRDQEGMKPEVAKLERLHDMVMTFGEHHRATFYMGAAEVARFDRRTAEVLPQLREYRVKERAAGFAGKEPDNVLSVYIARFAWLHEEDDPQMYDEVESALSYLADDSGTEVEMVVLMIQQLVEYRCLHGEPTATLEGIERAHRRLARRTGEEKQPLLHLSRINVNATVWLLAPTEELRRSGWEQMVRILVEEGPCEVATRWSIPASIGTAVWFLMLDDRETAETFLRPHLDAEASHPIFAIPEGDTDEERLDLWIRSLPEPMTQPSM